ncbi:MAG: ABC transporter substrate-binding protein [Myxococcaceae bacterium]
MKTPSRSGEFPEASLVEVLDFYCRSGQTAAVSISIPRPAGGEATGAFFIDSGVLVDARFEGREGAEAVRQALRTKLGKYHVELGSRSARRTVHEPWEALAAAAERSAPPKLYPVDGGAAPTPPPAPLPKLTPQRATAAASPPSLPTTSSGAHSSPPRGLGVRASSRDGLAAAVAPPPPAAPVPPAALSTSGPLHTSGPTTSPFSGPHTPPARGQPPPGTAPFSSVRSEARRSRLVPPVALLALAAVVGIGLAVGVAYLRNHSAPAPAVAVAPAAAPAPALPTAPKVAAVPGVSDSEISLGMAAPLTGVSKELGRQMRLGLEVAFARANAAGGVNGRKIKLVALDDGYEPARTKDVMRELAEQRGVFSFVGNVGTPTAAVAVPYALERKMLFFGPFTGASLLRKDPPDRYVFNYRASYGEETAAIVRYLVEIRHIKPDQIAVFAQDDSYGDAGFQGVAKELRRLKKSSNPILKVTYTRNTADVADAVARILDKKSNVAAVVMVATYRPAARFIEKVREQRPGMIFTNVSFVGSEALAEELVQLGPQYAQGVIITQVVPLPTGQSTVGLRYREALANFSPEEKPGFISLEGYVTGTLLLEGLKLAGRNLTADTLVDALESIHGLDLGLGVPLSFGLSEHQASHKVWGTVLDGTGSFQQLELE